MAVHSTAVVYPGTDIDESATVGPFAIIGYSFDIISEVAQTKIGREVRIGPYSIVGAGTTIGDHSCVSAGVSIGTNSVIGANTELFNRAEIHHDVLVGDAAWIGGYLCNQAVVGPSAVVYGRLIHRFVNAEVGIPEDSPVVEESAFVGDGAIIVGGVRVGFGAYVAAGTLVTRDVRRGRLVLGVPARDSGVAPKPFRDLTSNKPFVTYLS